MATGTLTTRGQHDWLAVSLIADQAYVLTLTGLTDTAVMDVGALTPASDRISSPTSAGATGATQTVWFEPTTTGLYYVDVSDEGTTGAYRVVAQPVASDYTNNVDTKGLVIVNGGTTFGTLTSVGQHDWLSVVLTANQAYQFTVNASSPFNFDIVGALMPATDRTNAFSLTGSGTAANVGWFTPTTSGTYYIDVSSLSGVSPYSVSAKTVAADYTDNFTTKGSVTIGGAATSGTLTSVEQHDWLAVSLTANTAYQFTVSGLTNSIAFAGALEPATEQVFTNVPSGSASAQNNLVWFTPSASGTYYLDVSSFGTVPGTYRVTGRIVAADYTDNATTAARVVVNGAATTGTLSSIGQHDWLGVTLTANQAYLFTVTGLSSNGGFVDAGTLTPDTVRVGSSNLANSSAGPGTLTDWFTPQTSGLYFIDVSDFVTTSSYSVAAQTVSADYTDNFTTKGRVIVAGAGGGVSTSGTLTSPGQHDWLSVSLTGNQAYLFTTTGLTASGLIDVGTLTPATDSVSSGLVGTGTTAGGSAWFRPTSSGTYYIDISDSGGNSRYTVSAMAVGADYTDNPTTTGLVVACYTDGTRILTNRGERAIETLVCGDRVFTLRSGRMRPIRWIGRRSIDLRRHAAPGRVLPIRIAAHAFGPGCPARDLRVSPDHALYIDGLLIPARSLVDGRAVTVDTDTRQVTYFHIELDTHDVVLAEGLPAETWLDIGNRHMFENAGLTMALHPNFAAPADGNFCAKLVTAGPELLETRRRLAQAERPQPMSTSTSSASSVATMSSAVSSVTATPSRVATGTPLTVTAPVAATR